MLIPWDEIMGQTQWVNPEQFGWGLPISERAIWSIWWRNMCWQGKWRYR